MDGCAFGSTRFLLPGCLRVALLWVVQLGAFAQHGKWMENSNKALIVALAQTSKAISLSADVAEAFTSP